MVVGAAGVLDDGFGAGFDGVLVFGVFALVGLVVVCVLSADVATFGDDVWRKNINQITNQRAAAKTIHTNTIRNTLLTIPGDSSYIVAPFFSIHTTPYR